MRRGKLAAALAAVFSLVVVTSLASFWFLYQEKKLFEVSILDIGQGDAILLEAPSGQVMLVDGGPDKKILRRLGEELPFWERRLDMVVISHPHEDHFAGLLEVIERYTIGALLITGIEVNNQMYLNFLKTAAAKQIPILIIEKPDRLALGEVSCQIIYPNHSLNGQWISNLNNSSIVMKVIYKDFELLLTGDAEQEEEAEILATGVNLQADILKVGHHGSETSSTEAFLKAVQPSVAVISSGEGNSYGHPSLRTLKRLERLGISVQRTDVSGTIHFKTDGYGFY